MKKIIIGLTVALLLLSLAVCSSAATYRKGDVNMDGKVNASDARTTLRVSASLEQISDDQKLICDMNEDGRITAADARTVLRISAKLEPEKGDITIGGSADASDKTELLSGIGMSTDAFMEKFGSMQKVNTGSNKISYSNDYITIVSDPEMIHEGNVSSISITGGDYMLCGVYTGMSSSDAFNTLKNSKWIVQQNTSSLLIFSKNGMFVKVAVADGVVTFVEYYIAVSLVDPDDTTPSDPDETINEAYNKLPYTAKAYLQGNFGFDGYSYNKSAKDPVTMYITPNNIKAGMYMEMENNEKLYVDVIIRNPSTKPKMIIINQKSKAYCEVDSVTMSLLNIDTDDLKMSSSFVDASKLTITEKTVKESSVIYTVYNVKSPSESCDLYMIGDDIKRIYTYDKAGILKNRIDIENFYTTVPDSVYSLSGYKKGSLLEIFDIV